VQFGRGGVVAVKYLYWAISLIDNLAICLCLPLFLPPIWYLIDNLAILLYLSLFLALISYYFASASYLVTCNWSIEVFADYELLNWVCLYFTAEETHRIPLDQIKTFDRNYSGLWIQIEHFIKSQDGDLSLYCLVSDRIVVTDRILRLSPCQALATNYCVGSVCACFVWYLIFIAVHLGNKVMFYQLSPLTLQVTVNCTMSPILNPTVGGSAILQTAVTHCM